MPTAATYLHPETVLTAKSVEQIPFVGFSWPKLAVCFGLAALRFVMKAHRSYVALDALQPINHILGRRKAAVPARDIRRRGETLLLRVAALLTDLPHQRGGVIEIGISPICATPVRPVVAIQLD